MTDWLDEKESDYGYIHRVSGPLVIAENMSGAAMYELVSGRITPTRKPTLEG